jgi:hypothetical protein
VANHTPGPWKIVFGGDSETFKIVKRSKTISGWTDRLRKREEHFANARLLVNAPEALDVCLRLVMNQPRKLLNVLICPLCEGPRIEEDSFKHGEFCPVVLARAVINLVEGEDETN